MFREFRRKPVYSTGKPEDVDEPTTHRFHGSRGVWRKRSRFARDTPLSSFLGRNFAKHNCRIVCKFRYRISKHSANDPETSWRWFVTQFSRSCLHFVTICDRFDDESSGWLMVFMLRDRASDSILIIIRVPIQGNVSLNRDWWLITGKISTNNRDTPWEIRRIYQIGSHRRWINVRLAE